MSYLAIKNIYLKKGQFELKNISFEIDKGDFVAIIGKTGSGKTMLIETIAGIHKPSSGKIYLDGEDITKKPIEKRNIGLVYQDFMLFRHMRVKDNLLFPKNVDLRLLEEFVEIFGLKKLLNKYPDQLSGGEKQKTAIARALLTKPKLLIMDEPLSSIDFSFRGTFIKFIKEIHKRFNLTTLYVTHNLKEAIKLSNKCGVIINGTLVQFGQTKNVFEKPISREVAEFLGFKNILPGKLIGSRKQFFSVSPYAIKINTDGDFSFNAELIDLEETDLGYNVMLKVKNEYLHAFCFNKPKQPITVYFDKKDIAEFD